jgi:hypothetical protein
VSVSLPKLPSGVYTVRYWVLSSDLRETRGSFEFTVATGPPDWPRARRTAEAKAHAAGKPRAPGKVLPQQVLSGEP